MFIMDECVNYNQHFSSLLSIKTVRRENSYIFCIETVSHISTWLNKIIATSYVVTSRNRIGFISAHIIIIDDMLNGLRIEGTGV